jgi:vancomycin resistance protein VanJ
MGRTRRGLAKLTTFACYAYPLSVLVIASFLRWGSDRNAFWAAALYLPPHGYLLPSLIALPMLALPVPRRAWMAWLLGVLLCVFGLMHGRLHFPASSDQARTVVTMNVDSAQAGAGAIAKAILRHQPDLVFLQEVGGQGEDLARELRPVLAHTLVHDQFVIACHYPILDLEIPPSSFVRGRDRTPRFIRVRVEFPEGALAAYNVHPVSPRPAFSIVRGNGFRAEIRSGRLFGPEARDTIWKNIEVRGFELAETAKRAERDELPLVIAGDLNVPDNSPFFARTFGFLSDAFADAGLGFGFTYPAKAPFLRLDRILTSREVRVLDAEVDCEGLSDHRCLVTKLDFSRH